MLIVSEGPAGRAPRPPPGSRSGPAGRALRSGRRRGAVASPGRGFSGLLSPVGLRPVDRIGGAGCASPPYPRDLAPDQQSWSCAPALRPGAVALPGRGFFGLLFLVGLQHVDRIGGAGWASPPSPPGLSLRPSRAGPPLRTEAWCGGVTGPRLLWPSLPGRPSSC